MKLNAYLTFKGNCEEAMKFYQQVLGGDMVAMITHRGTPAEEGTPDEWLDKIIHARLVIGDQVLMASDAPPQFQTTPAGFSVNIGTDDVAEAERIFGALAEGANVMMPLSETFWAKRFGMLVDRYGTPWMVNCEVQG